jgi:histidinol-phosphate aminotransferase
MTTLVKAQSGLDCISAYVPGKPVEEVQREFGLMEVIKLASNENPLGPSPKAVAAMEAALQQLNSYPDGQCYHLRRSLAAHLGVSPDQVTAGNGADGLILQTCMAYVDQDDEVIVSRSSFPMYDMYACAMRAKLIKTPLKGYGLDLDAMLAAITPKTKLIFVCNPNNPTGTVVTSAEVEAFMQRVPDHVLIVFDEAYNEFVDSPDYPQTVQYVHAGRKNVMILRTYSKVYGLAGIRLGYAIGDPDVLAPLNRIKEPFAVNLLAQAAGVAALEDEEYLKRSVAANDAGRHYLFGEFERMGLFFIKSYTNFVMVRVGPQAKQIVQALLAKGIVVRPCHGYDLPDFLRITVGSAVQNARLIEALENALQAV